METVTVKPHFSGHSALQCGSCHGAGYRAKEDASEDGWAHGPCADCSGTGFVQCRECQDGTAADVELHEGGAYCLACFPGALEYDRAMAEPKRFIERTTDAGRAA